MKTYTLIFALSFISSIAFAQAVSSAGTLKGGGSGAAAASYAATGKAISPSDTTKKTNPARLSTNMTVAKQTQGTTFGEKVNQGLHAAGSALATGAAKTESPLYEGNSNAQNNPLYKSETKVASPGNPIGGIIVKGGKN